ncbi:MAG: S8 family serine peptidase [Bacteroidia bacterium]|nr:S8 family serine peptidase [Bacteroidia bacterium]
MKLKTSFSSLMMLLCAFTFASEAKYDLLLSSGTVRTAPNLEMALYMAPAGDEIFGGNYYRYIQFQDIPDNATREKLKASGISLLLYLPNYTFMAAIRKDADLQVLRSCGVRGLYQVLPEYKMLEELAAGVRTGQFPGFAVGANGKIGVTFTYYSDLTHAAVMTWLQNAKMEVTYQNFFSNRITVWLDKGEITSFVGMPFVCAAELKDDLPVPDNNVGRTLHRDNYLATDYSGGRKYNGSNVRVCLQDDGVIGPHVDYTGRLNAQFITFNNGDHGDHCAGIIMGGGNRDPLTRGMGWGAQLYVYEAAPNYQGFDSINIHYNSYGIVITSTSYSDGCNAGYTTLAQQLDQQIYTMPNLIHVFSAGNNGTADCGYGAGAGWGNVTGGHKHSKNSIAVGNLDYIDQLASSSSRGPVHDGRMKPEVCAQGTNVNSTINPPANGYGLKTGTSMSCPAVSGTFAELYHAYKTLNGNQNPPSGLIKAIVMNTADDLGNAGPDYKFGYGRINGLKAAQTLESNYYVSGSVSQGNTNTHTITVPSNVRQIKVMVYWHDYQAAVNASVALVNNLNTSLTDPSSAVWNPWVLDYTPNATNLNALAVRGTDIRNNHEQITLDNPAAGTYSLRVNGAVVPQGPQTYYVTWFFETDAPVVTYPIGGEGFVPGETETVRWDAFGNTGTFNVEYTTDNGNTWNTINNSVPAAQRYFNWVVPSALSGECKVRVTRNSASDLSDANFSIINVPTNIQVSWACPDSVMLTWNPVTGATSYDVFKLGTMYMDSVGTSTTTNKVLTNVPANQTHWFSVRARGPQNAVGRRAWAIEKTPGTFNCPIAVDASVNMINSPNGTLPTCQNPGTTVVNITIYNPGTSPLTNVPVHYSINNGPAVNETANGTIASFASMNFSFVTTANLGTPGNYNIAAWATYPSDGNILNDTAYSTVVVANGTTQSIPFNENFETFTLCGTASDCGTTVCNLMNGFINESSSLIDNMDWRTDENDTPSSGTGPATDYNPGTATGNYLYTEASACFSQTAYLLSPCIDLTNATNPWLTFAYHMYGADMGTLTVDVFGNNMWNNGAFTASGQLGNQWNVAYVNLNAYIGQVINIRWRGTTGANFASDMALDAVSISNLTSSVNSPIFADDVILFPNPGQGVFEMIIQGLSDEKLSWELVDITGRVILSHDLGTVSGNVKEVLDLSSESSGIYYLRIRKGETYQYLKLTKI